MESHHMNHGKIQLPQIEQYSRLYSLAPIGAGTRFVESLTGYISRLAETHSIQTGTLIAEEITIEVVEERRGSKKLFPILTTFKSHMFISGIFRFWVVLIDPFHSVSTQ